MTARRFRSGAVSALRLAWRAARVERAFSAAIGITPAPLRRRILSARAAFSVAAATPLELGAADEVADTFRSGLELLLERNGPDALGDYLEFGVYIGTSLAAMHRVTDELGLEQMRLFGFDSFEGLPDGAADEDGGYWTPGDFAVSERAARENLTRLGVDWSRVTLVPGWYDKTLKPETARRHGIRKASIVMVDCDLYSSAAAALAFCEPLVADDAIFVFDDWGAGGLGERRLGEARAFHEMLERHPDLAAKEIPSYEPARAFLVSRTS